MCHTCAITSNCCCLGMAKPAQLCPAVAAGLHAMNNGENTAPAAALTCLTEEDARLSWLCCSAWVLCYWQSGLRPAQCCAAIQQQQRILSRSRCVWALHRQAPHDAAAAAHANALLEAGVLHRVTWRPVFCTGSLRRRTAAEQHECQRVWPAAVRSYATRRHGGRCSAPGR